MIEDDVPAIALAVIADCVVATAQEIIANEVWPPPKDREIPTGAAEYLIATAERIYAADKKFAKKVRARGNIGRDTLYLFMEHWLASWLKKCAPQIFKTLPSGYGWSYSPTLHGGKNRMSDAIDAKSAKTRASIAIRLIKRGQTSGRPFSNCFEMGDGDDVVKEIVRRAETDPEIERRYPHVAVWRSDRAGAHLALLAPPAPLTLVDAEGRDPIRRALEVMVRNEKISAWLIANDPQAMIQALSALGFKRCPDCKRVIDKPQRAAGYFERCDTCEGERDA